MQIATGPTEFLAQWAAKKIGIEAFDRLHSAIGVCRDGKLAAVAVYTNHRKHPEGGSVEISFAADSPRWATREAVRLFLAHPFYSLGCHRITAIVEKRRKRSRKLCRGVGFVLEGKARKALPGKRDACIYGLLKEEFEAGKYGQGLSAVAA